MTELIPGKRYRFAVEGEAIDTDSIHTPGGWCIMTNREGTVELLPDPLPTTPGSVVSHAERGVLVRTARDSFPWTPVHDAGHMLFDDAQVKGATVLFDAGAGRA